MVVPATGAVVSVRFPFSDLSQTKLRPAVILAEVGQGDWILCQVTSKPYRDAHAVTLTSSSFSIGSLRVTSYARPGKLFTANQELMVTEIGSLKKALLTQIVEALIAILRSGIAR